MIPDPSQIAFDCHVPIKDGVGSGSTSPGTFTSSSDDNPETGPPHLHFFDSLAPGMPSDVSLFYPYAKGPQGLFPNPLVIEDVGSDPAQSLPCTSSLWAGAVAPINTTTAADSTRINQSLPNFEETIDSLEWPWFNNPESKLADQAMPSIANTDLKTQPSSTEQPQKQELTAPVPAETLQYSSVLDNGPRKTPSGRLPSGIQSVATTRKRKQRKSISLQTPQPQQQQQQQAKPLQIVQEDGQGGSFAPADFVSPPRGARRKGPLSTAGRANAGMRRKNKDTCVQCRLNKRKVFIP